MYKKQLTVQRILCLAALIAAVIMFVYALGIMTDLYDSLYFVRRGSDPERTAVHGSTIFYTMQDFNQQLLLASIGMILLGVVLFITNTHSRRKYYIGNYVSSGVYVAAAIASTIWSHGQIEAFKLEFLDIDFAALAEHAERMNTLYTESTFWFDIHYAVFGILLVVAAGLVINVIWKNKVMAEEKALIGQKGV